MKTLLVPAVVIAAALSGALSAQTTGVVAGQASENPGRPMVTGGTVTGHVFCSDTQRPAKFANVQLMQERPADTSTTQRRNPFAGSGPQYSSVAQGRTALDGSFSISGVTPGDYYVVANAPGYVSAASVARQEGSAIRASQVHVDANRSADVQVTIDRGAVLSGRLLFDDGTPAAGVSVQLRAADSSATASAGGGFIVYVSGFGGSDTTDDRGVYRISGVPPGTYNVMATLQTEGTERSPGRRGGGGFPQVVTVYAPGTMHKVGARVIEVHGTETLDGVDMQVALAGLHTVRGVVEAKSDSHPLSGGLVSLTDPADPGMTRIAQIGTDGTFALEYLPPGTYSLHVRGSDGQPGRGPGSSNNAPGVRYMPGTVPVIVGDHDASVDTVFLSTAAATGTPSAQ